MFGYIPDPHSDKDFAYGVHAGRPFTDFPKRMNYEASMGPAADQGSTYECVAYAVAGLKRFHEWRESKTWLTFDPHDLYTKCKAVDGIPNSHGTYPRVAMDVLRETGMVANDGTRHKVGATVRLRSVDEIRQAVATEGPVILGIRIDVAYFAHIGRNSFEGSGIDAAHYSGHCMLVVGYDDESEEFRLRNSWGEAWGDNGHFWLPYDYLFSIDPTFDAWAATDVMGAAHA